jgi:GNAT superfamily N-acetyltransferase
MIKIIKAEEKHIPEIKKLWWEFIWFHADIEPIFTPSEDALTGFENEFLRKAMKSENSLIQVALDGERVVGYAISDIQDIPGSKIGKCGNINHLHVAKEYRRQGIGKMMYEAILPWFHLQGINVIEIQLTAKNEVACSFWRKLGYRDLQHTWYREI